MIQDVGELAYQMYFSELNDSDNTKSKPETIDNNIYSGKKPTIHYKEENHVKNDNEILAGRTYADGNISTIDELAEIIKKLCNAAWGNDWGEFSPDIKYGENSDEIILPQITIEINTRDVAENMSIKPSLIDYIKEKDNEGNETGDVFLVYRQFYDCNVEFNIYGRNSQEAREYTKKLETLLTVYAGYLKRQGLSEIFFEREVSPKSSLNYTENKNMRSIYYYIRLEEITLVKQSLINNINTKLGLKTTSTEEVTSLFQKDLKEREAIFDLEFFKGDNGITYNK